MKTLTNNIIIWLGLLVFPALNAMGWHYWDNGAPDHYWSTAANWQGDVLPAAGESPRVDMGGSQGALITSSMTNLPLYGTVCVGGSGLGRLSMTGGNLFSDNAALGSNAGSSATWDISAGNVSVNNYITIGDQGSATIYCSGGMVNANRAKCGVYAGSYGLLEISGQGNVNFPNYITVGISGYGKLILKGGSLTAGSLNVAQEAGSLGSIAINKGTLKAANLVIGLGEAAVDVNGGSLILDGQINQLPAAVVARGGNKDWYLKYDYDNVNNVTVISAKRKPPVYFWTEQFDYAQGDTLGLREIPAEVYQVHSPTSEDYIKFSNHPQIIPFKGYLYCVWNGHPIDEISTDKWAFYSRSADGRNWSSLQIIGPNQRASGGWWTDGQTLVCYLVSGTIMSGGTTEVCTSTDGINWTAATVMMPNLSPSEGARALPDGRLIMASHGIQTGEFAGIFGTKIVYTDTPTGLGGWQTANLTPLPEIQISGNNIYTRSIESSWYRRPDDTLVMLFRDLWFDANLRTWRVTASISEDRGQNWTQPVLTNMIDSDSKQCAGNLPDGTVYMINNPSPTRRRVPLTITLSNDGINFDRTFIIRGTPQPLRYEGGDKTLGYSYPDAVIWGDYLYVSYATNKEDVEISRIPLMALYGNFGVVEDFDDLTKNGMTNEWQVLGGANLDLTSYPQPVHSVQSLRIDYANTTAPYYSAMKKSFVEPQDWSKRETSALDISFLGSSGNVGTVFYIELSDGTNNSRKYYNNADSNATKSDKWRTWRMAMRDFAGVNLSNITSITVGIGNGINPGQTVNGVIYIDDIRVYPPRCVNGYPAGDFNKDCMVNFKDFALFLTGWVEEEN